MPVDLVPRADGTFSINYKLLGFIPLDIEFLDILDVSFHKIEGKSYMGTNMDGVTMGVAEKFKPEVVPEVWRKRVGRYSIVNDEGKPDKDTQLFIQKAGLTHDKRTELFLLDLVIQGSKISYPLTVINDNEAVTTGVGRNLGETIRAVDTGEGTYLYYSGLTFMLK
jgi:hypothetical protein